MRPTVAVGVHVHPSSGLPSQYSHPSLGLTWPTPDPSGRLVVKRYSQGRRPTSEDLCRVDIEIPGYRLD
jgi:hypothetical protein